MMLKEVADRVVSMRNSSRIARRKQNTRNLLLGATIGTAAGAAAGLLLAPRSGRQTREQIAQRAGQTLDTIKTRVSSTGEMIADRVHETSSRLREAAETCSEAIKEAVHEPEKEVEGKSKKKK